MTKRELEVGDRVSVVGASANGCGTAYMPLPGIVKALGGPSIRDMVYVTMDSRGEDDQREYLVHRRQCRRLIPKARKTVWVNEYTNGPGSAFNSKEVAADAASGSALRIAVEYREVKKGDGK